MDTLLKLFFCGCFIYLFTTYAIRRVWLLYHADISEDIPLRYNGNSLILFLQEYLFTCLHVVLLLADYLITPLKFFTKKFKPDCEQYSQPPVILIHGYMMRGGVLWPMWYYLKRNGFKRAFIFTYQKPWKDIPFFAEQLADEIKKILSLCNTDKVDLVAHSMGGLVARYYIDCLGGEQHVERLVTLGTPHNGTLLWALSSFMSGAQMRPGSQFLTHLTENDDKLEKVSTCSIYSNFDQLIIPEESSVLEGKNMINRKVQDLGHAGLVYSRRVYCHIIEALERKSLT
jgi:triacylglycerol esterase/lipase EstA (alpha/beta hydrolase family)